jgi:chromosome segregation ATPase
MDTLRAQLAASEAKVAELTESLKTNECEAESFTTVASMLQRKITELAASLERSERTNGILKREVSIMQDGSEAVERDLEIERERSEELQQKLEEVVVLAKESMERCESLERELEVARTGENALEQLKAELVAVKEELELKSAEAKDFESKAAMLADRLLSAEVAKIQLGDEREKDTEVAQAAVAAAEGQLAQTKQMLEVARNALNKSQVDLTKATVELNIQQGRITELEAEVVLLTEALRSSEAEKEALEVQASGDMATARAALAQGQDDLMNATRVMEEMLDAQSAGLAAKEEAIRQREAAAKQTEDAALAIRSSIADRTAELEAKLVESGRALSTTESRIEELKELHEQSITDKAELVASLHVILQQRDDQIAAIKDEVAGLHEAVALRVTELETNRLEFEAIVATKDAEMSRALEERAKVEELLRVAEVRFEALVAEEVRKFKELEAEAETSRVSAAEVATKLADAEKMVADGKRRNALASFTFGETARRSFNQSFFC